MASASNVLTGTTPAAGGAALNAITNFAAASAGTGAIDLSWDNASDEDAYVVEKSTDAGTTWSPLALKDQNVTSHQDTGLTAATTYHYRLRSIDDQPGSSPLVTANATTDAAAAPQTGLTGHWDGSTFDTGNDRWDGVNTAVDRFVKTAGSAATVASDWQSTGEPAVLFPAGAKYEFQFASSYNHLAAGQTTSARGSLYVVFRSANLSGTREVLRFEDENTPASYMMYYASTTDSLRWFSDRGVGSAELAAGTIDDGDVNVIGGTRAATSNSSNVLLELNSDSSVEGACDGVGSDATELDNLVIGNDGLAIEIAEILFYTGSTTTLNLAHHNSVQSYLTTKYGK